MVIAPPKIPLMNNLLNGRSKKRSVGEFEVVDVLEINGSACF